MFFARPVHVQTTTKDNIPTISLSSSDKNLPEEVIQDILAHSRILYVIKVQSIPRLHRSFPVLPVG